MTSLAWPDSPAYAGLQPPPPDTTPTPPSTQFDANVEKWRPLVQKYFQPGDVDKALYVIQHESGGNPSIMNRDAAVNGRSPGLFQITAKNAKAAGIDGTNPEQATKWAAEQVANHGWTDWGEGTHNPANGQNFGALGTPSAYGPGGTGSAIGSAIGGLIKARADSGLVGTSAVLPPSERGAVLNAINAAQPNADAPTKAALDQAGYSAPATDAVATAQNLTPSAGLVANLDGTTATRAALEAAMPSARLTDGIAGASAAAPNAAVLNTLNGIGGLERIPHSTMATDAQAGASAGLPSMLLDQTTNMPSERAKLKTVAPLTTNLAVRQQLLRDEIARAQATPDPVLNLAGTAQRAYDSINPDLPYGIGPAIRNYVQPAVGAALNASTGGNIVKSLTGFDPGNTGAGMLVPSHAADTALALAPFAGEAGTLAKAGIAEGGARIAASETASRLLPDTVLTEQRVGAALARRAGVNPIEGARARVGLAGAGLTPEEEAAGGVVSHATAEAPLSDFEKAMQASLAAGREGAITQGAAKAADYVAAARAGQAAEGSAYAEATDLSKRVAAMTGQDPNAVRQTAVSKTKQALDAAKAQIVAARAPAEDQLLNTGLHSGVSGKLGQSPLEQSIAERRPVNPVHIPDSAADLEKIVAEEKYRAGLGTAPPPTPEPPKPNLISHAMAILGMPQTIMASTDVGQIGRQAQILGWSHRQQWLEAAKQGIAAFKDGDMALKARAAVESSPWYNFAKESGLHIYGWGDDVADASERVPGFTGLNQSRISRMANDFGPVKASERSFATTLNVQGMSAFEQEANAMWQAGERNPKAYKDLADVINHARGYSNLNPGAIIPGFNTFFSGRRMAANFQLLLDPITRSGSIFEPSARQLAAKNLAAFAGGNAAMLGFLGTTGAMAGGAWSVDADPRSGDFGKLRIGNTRIDTLGGFSPIVRLLSRVGAEGIDSVAGTNLSRPNEDWHKEIVQFFRNKEAPVPALITDELSGKDSLGRPVTLSPDRLASMFTPFITQDVYDAIQQNNGANKALALPAAALSGIGLGTGTYKTQEDYRNEETGKLQPDANGRYPTKSGAKPESFADLNDFGVRKQIDQNIKDAGHAFAESQAQIAGDQSKADIDKQVQQMTDAHTAGQLTEPIGDRLKRIGGQRLGRGDTLKAFYDQQNIQPSSDFAKRFAGLIGDSDKGTGYAGLANNFTDDYGQLDFGALKKAQADYVSKLPANDQALMQSYLKYQESLKSPIEKERDKYYADKEAAGYYTDKPGESLTDRKTRLTALGKQLDQQHPELDAEGWYLGGGTKDSSTTPSLSTAAAVQMALQRVKEDGLQNFPVKLAGLPRPISENKGTIDAFNEKNAKGETFGERAAKFISGFQVERDKEKTAGQMYQGKKYEDLTDSQQHAVASKIRSDVLKSSPDLEAYLAWMGQRDTINGNNGAINTLRHLREEYGRETGRDPAKNPIKYE